MAYRPRHAVALRSNNRPPPTHPCPWKHLHAGRTTTAMLRGCDTGQTKINWNSRPVGHDNEFGICILQEKLALETVGHLLETNRNLENNLVNVVGRLRRMKMIPFRA